MNGTIRHTFVAFLTALLLAPLAAQAQLNVINGDFSDLAGLTQGTGGWHSGLPKGWRGSESTYAVHAKRDASSPICNPASLGFLRQNVGVLDKASDVTLTFDVSEPWQTDDSIGSWGYNENTPYTTADAVVDKIVDIVSKNGNMLLNIPIRADGTLDETATAILEDLGEWFDVNGEGIYFQPRVRLPDNLRRMFDRDARRSRYNHGNAGAKRAAMKSSPWLAERLSGSRRLVD